MTDSVKVLSKWSQLNYIDDVWEPLYSEDKVYIAKWKIKRSKHDIHLVFPKVSATSDYYGDWYLPRKEVGRKTFNNNGMECYAVPFSKFKKLKLVDKEPAFI